MMSPYAFHQFWLNVEDEKVGELLRIFTFLSRAEIEAARGQTWRSRSCGPAEGAGGRGDHPRPRRRGDRARQGGGRRALRRRGPARAGAETLASALREAGSTQAAKGTGIVDLLVESGLVKSKGEARRTISKGGAYLNNERITDVEHVPDGDDLIAGLWPVLRRGKKNLAGVEMR